MQPDQESTSHLPMPQSLAAMSPLGWFAVVPEMMATESERARRLERAAPRRVVREAGNGTPWRDLRDFAQRLASAWGLAQQSYTLARISSRECTPESMANSVSLATGAEQNSRPAPASPRPARDKSVSRLGFFLLRRAPLRPSPILGESRSNPAVKGRFDHHQQVRNFTDREE